MFQRNLLSFWGFSNAIALLFCDIFPYSYFQVNVNSLKLRLTLCSHHSPLRAVGNGCESFQFDCRIVIYKVDVLYTWNYGGPHILDTIRTNKMNFCGYNAYVL